MHVCYNEQLDLVRNNSQMVVAAAVPAIQCNKALGTPSRPVGTPFVNIAWYSNARATVCAGVQRLDTEQLLLIKHQNPMAYGSHVTAHQRT